MLALTFIGASGTGKTTVAKRVADTLDLAYVGTGEIARQMAKADHFTQAGLAQGHMAPELAMRMEVGARIEAATIQSGDFVIDGFPRTVEQLYILESVPQIQPMYFVMEVPTILCFRRLIGRGREDDHPDAVATRLRAYREQTKPMIDIIYGWEQRVNGTLRVETQVEYVVDHYRSAVRESDADASETLLD